MVRVAICETTSHIVTAVTHNFVTIWLNSMVFCFSPSLLQMLLWGMCITNTSILKRHLCPTVYWTGLLLLFKFTQTHAFCTLYSLSLYGMCWSIHSYILQQCSVGHGVLRYFCHLNIDHLNTVRYSAGDPGSWYSYGCQLIQAIPQNTATPQKLLRDSWRNLTLVIMPQIQIW